MDARGNADEEHVRDLASRIAAGMGLEVVDLVFHRSGARWLLRIEIDRPGARGVGIEDCKGLSVSLGAALDDEDLIEHSYTLEISSPGIDRPIRSADDVRRNSGRRVVVEWSSSTGGSGAVRGVLLRLDGNDCLVLEDGGREARIPLRDIVRARQEPEF